MRENAKILGIVLVVLVGIDALERVSALLAYSIASLLFGLCIGWLLAQRKGPSNGAE